MSFIDSMKSFYYKCEDKWYDILDKINEKVPVYKIIEPIDKVFPSFILFIIIVLLILFSTIFLLFAPMLVPASLAVTVSVSDIDGFPIDNADVSILLTDDNSLLNSGITDEFGEFKFELGEDQDSLDVFILAEASGYEKKELKTSIVKGEITEIKLKKIEETGGGNAGLGEAEIYTIKVVDKQTKTIISNKKVTLSLSCGSGSIDPDYFDETYGEFKVNKPGNCTPLYATASAEGYVDSTKQAVLKTPYLIEMTKGSLKETKGKLKVTVYDEKNNSLQDITVLVVTADNIDKRELVTDIFGSVLFDDLTPGQYNISATQQNDKKITRIADKKGIQVNSGKIKEETLNFSAFGGGIYKIIFKVIDGKDKNAVSDVGIILYKNGVQLKVNKSYTDAEGKFTLILDEPDKDATFNALLYKDGYVPKVVSLNVIPKDSTEIQEFLLDKYNKEDPLNVKYGTVLVTVVDEESLPVENAITSIFDSVTGIPFYTSDTNKDGQVLFEPLPAGKYYAKAANEQNTKLGQSDSQELKNGETLNIQVKLTTGKTSIEVIALNAKNLGQRIEKALAEFYSIPANSNDESIFVTSCVTNKDGNCSVSLDTKYQDVYVKVSKEGYMSYIAGNNGHNIILVANDNVQVIAKLYELAQGDPTSGIAVHAIGVYNGEPWGMKIGDLAITLGSDKETELDYYALFDVFVYEPDEDANNVYFNIRTGNEKSGIVSIMDYVNNQGDPIFLDPIEPLRIPSLKTVSVSSCTDLTKPEETLFKMPNCPTQLLKGKSSLAETTKLANTVIPVIIHFKVRRNVQLGTVVTLISNTKISKNESIFDAESGIINRQIGDSMTLDQIKLQCQQLPQGKGLIWQQLTMEKDLGGGAETVISQDRSNLDKQNNIWNFGSVDDPLLSLQEYFLHYIIFNCSEKEKQNLLLRLATSGTFTINNQSLQEFSNVDIGGYSILKEPEKTILNFPLQDMENPTKHVLDINLLQPSNVLMQAKVNCNVANTDSLYLVLDQTYLIPDQPIIISGETLTGKKAKIGNANIKLNKIVGDQYQEITTTTSENEGDSKGSFVVLVSTKAKIGDVYQLTASKNAHLPASPIIIKVAYPSNYAQIKCITKSDKSLDYILSNNSITFTLENKCAVDLNIDFVDQDNEFLYSPAISEFPQYPQYPSERVELKSGKLIEVTLKAKDNIIQGIHPIYLTASNDFIKKTSAGLIEVTVSDRTSAFSLQSLVFDFKQGITPTPLFNLLNSKPYYQKMPDEVSLAWLLDYFAVSPRIVETAVGDNFSEPKCTEKAGIKVILTAKYSCYDVDFTKEKVLLDQTQISLPVYSPKLNNMADAVTNLSAEAKKNCTGKLKEQIEEGKPTDIDTKGIVKFIDDTYFSGFYTLIIKHYGETAFKAYSIDVYPDRFWLESPIKNKEKDFNAWHFLFGDLKSILITDYAINATSSPVFKNDAQNLFNYAQNLFNFLKDNIDGQIGLDTAADKAYYSNKSITTIANKFVSLMDQKFDVLEGGKNTNCYYSRFRKEFDAYLRANIILWLSSYNMEGRTTEKQYLENDIFTPELLAEMGVLVTGAKEVFIEKLNKASKLKKAIISLSDLPASENIQLNAVSDVELQSYASDIDSMIDEVENKVVTEVGIYPALVAPDYYALVYGLIDKVSAEFDKKISGKCIDYYWKEALLNSVTKSFIKNSKIRKKLNKPPSDIPYATVKNDYLDFWGVIDIPVEPSSDDQDYLTKMKAYKDKWFEWQKKVSCVVETDLTAKCVAKKINEHCALHPGSCCNNHCKDAFISEYPDIALSNVMPNINCNHSSDTKSYCSVCGFYSADNPCFQWYNECNNSKEHDFSACESNTNFIKKILSILDSGVFNQRLNTIINKIAAALGVDDVKTIEAETPDITFGLGFKLYPENANARYWIQSPNPSNTPVLNLACDSPMPQDKFSNKTDTSKVKSVPFALELINPFMGDVYKDLTVSDVIDYDK